MTTEKSCYQFVLRESSNENDSTNQPTSTSTPAVAERSPNPLRSVKRPRPVKSCLECRTRKLKCDRILPCSQCYRSKRVCKYANEHENENGSDGSEGESDRPAKRQHHTCLAAHHMAGGPSRERRASLTAAATRGGSQPRHAALTMEDMAARLARLEELLGETMLPLERRDAPPSRAFRHRPHHFPRPSLPSPATLRALSVKGDLRTRVFGQNSTKVLLNLFDEAMDFMRNMARTEGIRELFGDLQRLYKALRKENHKAREPITVFVDSMMPVQKRMADILPRRAVCDRLLDAYIGISEGLYRVVHIPSFRKEYEQFWSNQRTNDGFLPRLLCMMSIASRFDTHSKGLGHDRSEGVHSPTACALVRHWLDSLRGKQLVDTNTLQAEILLLHAARTVAPRPQDSWTQVGYIFRMAMTMGLHRDSSEFRQLSPFAGEHRRRLWYTIVDMDLHISLQCNLPCSAGHGEYTCKPPRNLDDSEIYPEMKELPPSKPLDQATSTQLQAYAASTLPWRLRVSSILARINSVDDYEEVMEVGGRLEQMLDDVNCLFPRTASLDSQQKYKQWRDRALLDMHIRRPLLELWRPFVLGTRNCPSQIASSYLKSCMTMLTYMDELDPRTPGYADVVHMYQIMLKQDIIQAAFSVCYFILNAPDNRAENGKGLEGHWLPGPCSKQSETLASFVDGRPMWSAAAMITTVENTLESLVGLIKDSTHDLKDIVALSVVLESVQTHSEHKFQKIKEGIKKILDVVTQVVFTKADALISLPLTPALSTSLDRPDTYTGNTSVLGAFGNDSYAPDVNILDDYPWDNFLDYWNAGTGPMDHT